MNIMHATSDANRCFYYTFYNKNSDLKCLAYGAARLYCILLCPSGSLVIVGVVDIVWILLFSFVVVACRLGFGVDRAYIFSFVRVEHFLHQIH